MPRSFLAYLVQGVLCCCLLAPVALQAATSAVETPLDTTPISKTPNSSLIKVTYTSDVPGNFYRQGQPITLTQHIADMDVPQDADVTTTVANDQGCQIYYDKSTRTLSANGTVDDTIPVVTGTEVLPCGSYQVTTMVEGKQGGWGFGSTRISVSNGAAVKPTTLFGISYAGPLNTERARKDLDIFKQFGITWLRFPLHGWLLQGDAAPPAAEMYNKFIGDASERGMTLVAAFTPKVTVDPTVNPDQANKDYKESLLAAATRYGFKVKYWELMTVKAPSYPPGLRGIGYEELAKGRKELLQFDSSLKAIFPLEDPFDANALGLFFYKMPLKDDELGLHYNFIGLPENGTAVPKPPVMMLSAITGSEKTALKLKQPLHISVTEYGFDPTKKVPSAIYQAAMISRALILSRAAGIARTYWRHDPAATVDLPFTTDDGAAQPSLLALRTTLQMLDGVTSITPLTPTANSANKLHIYLLQYGTLQKGKHVKKQKTPQNGKNGTKGKPAQVHYKIAAWSDNGDARQGMAIKTTAAKITVTDLWGNGIELEPTANTALFQIDEFPRFIDLGTVNTADLTNVDQIANFSMPAERVTPGGKNTAAFYLRADQGLFSGGITGELRFHAWPVDPTGSTVKFALGPYQGNTFTFPLAIPDGAQDGKQMSEVSVEIMMGARRIGYLTMPVYYYSTLPKTPDQDQ
jgi:hypothetical protein